MPTAEIVQYFARQDRDMYLPMQVAIQCGPLLKNVKMASVMIMSRQNTRVLIKMLKGTPISLRILYSGHRKDVVYLYREDSLTGYLNRPEIQKALQSFGYRPGSCSQILKQLAFFAKESYAQYRRCPHEIGIFLGYPVEDVKSFVEHKGKNCLLRGYWKVYHDVACAMDTFEQYDSAKSRAVQELLQGKSIREIAC
ncbi:MAG: DUF3793 family protein [Lachnospiraceae bacterium]